MKTSLKAQANFLIGASTLVCSLFVSQVNAQSAELTDVVKAGKQLNKTASQSQLQINKLSDKTLSKLQQFKTVNKEIQGLNVYNQQMQSQTSNQLIELQQIAQSMNQVSIIERQVSPLMSRMISTLAEFVKLDVPFLPIERSERIASLNEMLNRADVSVSEKFRRVLEAYQVEVDYGRTIEAYSGLLEVAGSERDVDFLRIGRISLVYQTRDGNHLGRWDQTSQSWETLPGDYRLGVNKALRIARKQLAPDLVLVPLLVNSRANNIDKSTSAKQNSVN
ncbi:DUF3450 domain-containing protein [Colwellia sp. MB02u-10]|nr:DUF3450 domain-containing protein [Colwellia sp. MB02u-10]MBA6341248.1 DUF3450 domain-containing protein [Colwellia sp. MB02u-10]